MEHPEFPIHEKGIAGLEEKYDYEIAFVDKYVGQIRDGIATAGIAGDTMIVLVSDHGEAFGQHSYGGEKMFFHGQTLYDELLRVPLIVYVPGVAPRVVEQPVMLLDVAPTLIDAIKGKQPPSFQGRSLLPAIMGEPLPPRAVHAELLPASDWNHDAKMEIDAEGRTKLIYKISDNLFELYDLSEDPTEQKNLSGSRKDLASQMKQGITRWMESEL
jgi:arylsulfatase A-like enzyme